MVSEKQKQHQSHRPEIPYFNKTFIDYSFLHFLNYLDSKAQSECVKLVAYSRSSEIPIHRNDQHPEQFIQLIEKFRFSHGETPADRAALDNYNFRRKTFFAFFSYEDQ